MKYKELFKEGPKVSAISYGAWGISGRDWGSTDDQQSIEALHSALDAGVNLVDTADVYGFGHSDNLIRQVLADRKEKNIIIATKAGNDFYNFIDENGDPKITPNYKKEYLIGAAEKSLKRLNVDALDLLQLHSPSTEILKTEDPWEALYQLKKDGKIRYAGLSVQSFKESEQAFFLDQYHDILNVLQVRYNLLERDAEEILFPKAKKYGIGVLARIPLLFGFLTGKYNIDSTFGDDDHRRFNLSKENLEKYISRLKGLNSFFQKNNEYTKAQLSLGFLANSKYVTAAIPGGKNPKQVTENCSAADLPAEIFDELYS